MRQGTRVFVPFRKRSRQEVRISAHPHPQTVTVTATGIGIGIAIRTRTRKPPPATRTHEPVHPRATPNLQTPNLNASVFETSQTRNICLTV